MGKEIEKKFLVRKEFWKWLFSQKDISWNNLAIAQYYLCYSPEIRIRMLIRENKEYVEKAWITIKDDKKDKVREEFEFPIDYEEAVKVIQPFLDTSVTKDRHTFEYEGKLWEVDDFWGKQSGLSIAEIELESENEEIILPPGIGKEVTGDERYYNGYLSKNSYTEQEWVTN